MQDVVRVTKNGTSLAINVTKLCKENGIEAGDYLVIDMQKLDVSMHKPVGIEEARNIVRKVFLSAGQKWGLVGCELASYANDFYKYNIPDEEIYFVLRQLLEEGAIYVAEMGQYRMDPESDFWEGAEVAPHNSSRLDGNERVAESKRYGTE